MAIFVMMLGVLLQMVSQTTKIWQQVSGVSADRENAPARPSVNEEGFGEHGLPSGGQQIIYNFR